MGRRTTARQLIYGHAVGERYGHVVGDVVGAVCGHVVGDMVGAVCGHVVGDVVMWWVRDIYF